MIQQDRAKLAADELLAAAMLSDGWADGLQQLADAAEAGGASVVRVKGGSAAAHLSSTAWSERETEAIAGRAPPSPLRFYPDHVFGSGFRVDHDVWTDGAIRRDPYFQEFLRPHGVFFHAKLRLSAAPRERVTLTLKRRAELGPYEPVDIGVLDALVPGLHAAFSVARRVLDAEASGMARVLHQRGDPVLELDSSGRVLRAHGFGNEPDGIVVRQRRIVAADRLAQAALDRVVAAALTPEQAPGVVRIANRCGEPRFLQVVPVTGRARDVFLATAALVVIIEPGRASAASLTDAFRQAFGLTEREAQIGTLLMQGSSLPAIAERLHMGLGTVRNHLKSIFGKTGTRRQGELVALLCALQP